MGDTWRGEETSRLNRTSEISSRDCTRMDATWTHRSLDLHLTIVIHRDRGLIGRSRSSVYLRSIGRCRRIEEEPHDRGAIEPRSYSFRRGFISTRSDSSRPRSRTTIDGRSWPDRGPIVPRSGLFLKRNSSQTRCGIEAASSPSGTASMTLAKRLHDRSNGHNCRTNFSL